MSNPDRKSLTNNLSRRDFLRLVGGAALGAALGGCGPEQGLDQEESTATTEPTSKEAPATATSQPTPVPTEAPTQTPAPIETPVVSYLEQAGFSIVSNTEETLKFRKDIITFNFDILARTGGPEIPPEIDPVVLYQNITQRFEINQPINIKLEFDPTAQRYFYKLENGTLIDHMTDEPVEYEEGSYLFPFPNDIVPAETFASADLVAWSRSGANTMEQLKLEIKEGEEQEPSYQLIVISQAGPPDWAWQEPEEAITYPVDEEEIERLGLEVPVVEEEMETSEYLIGSENLTDELKEANNFKEEQRPITNGKNTIRILRHQDLTENLPFEFNEEIMTEEEFVSAVVDRWSLTQAKLFKPDEEVYINAIDWGWMLQEWDQLEGEPRLPRANVTDPETNQRKMEWLIQAFPYAIHEFEHITLIEMPAREVTNNDFSRDERTILGPDGKPLQIGLLNRGGYNLPRYFSTIVNIRPDKTKELIVVDFNSEYGRRKDSRLLTPPVNIEDDPEAHYMQIARIWGIINSAKNNINFSCMKEEEYRKSLWLALSDESWHIEVELLRKYTPDSADFQYFQTLLGADKFPATECPLNFQSEN